LLKNICRLKRVENPYLRGDFYLGVDVAGFGKDENTFEVFEKMSDKRIEQRGNLIEKRNFTTDTSKRILIMNDYYNFKRIGVDDGGVGFGVFSELMNDDRTKRKTLALNNSSRETNPDGTKSRKLLKEEMYINLLSLMEHGQILLLDDEEIINSLSSIQYEGDKIYGAYSHIAEGIIRGVWLASKDKGLKMFVHTF